MTTGSMFSGTTALDMAAAEVFDAEPAWFAVLDLAGEADIAITWPTAEHPTP